MWKKWLQILTLTKKNIRKTKTNRIQYQPQWRDGEGREGVDTKTETVRRFLSCFFPFLPFRFYEMRGVEFMKNCLGKKKITSINTDFWNLKDACASEKAKINKTQRVWENLFMFTFWTFFFNIKIINPYLHFALRLSAQVKQGKKSSWFWKWTFFSRAKEEILFSFGLPVLRGGVTIPFQIEFCFLLG